MVATATCIAVLIAAMVVAPRLDKSLLAVILYAAGLALMWSVSLRGALVPGFDIASEYYDLHQAVLTGIWHTAHPSDAYGAMLSVTVMQAELHFLSGVPDLDGVQGRLPGNRRAAPGGSLQPCAKDPLTPLGLRSQPLSSSCRHSTGAARPLPGKRLPRYFSPHCSLRRWMPGYGGARSGLWLPCSDWPWPCRITLRPTLRSPLSGSRSLQWVLSWFREIPRVTGAVAVAFIAALAGASYGTGR